MRYLDHTFQWGYNKNPLCTLSNWPILDSHISLCPSNWEAKSVPMSLSFKFKRLKMDEYVSRAHLRIHQLAVKWCREPSYSLCQSSKWVNAGRVQYVRSSNGLITIGVMTLFTSSVSPIVLLMCCNALARLRVVAYGSFRRWRCEPSYSLCQSSKWVNADLSSCTGILATPS